MIGPLVRVSLRHRVAVLAAAAVLAFLGLLAARSLDIDVLPDVDRPRLTVMTEAPGLAAEEVESLVTRPLELALSGLTSALRIRSSSTVGLSVIDVELDWGADVVAARQQTAERLALARDQLPRSLVPQIQPVSSIMGEIMLVAVTSDGSTGPMDLRSLADWVVRPRLAAIPGVSQIIPIGGDVRQFRIAPQPALMAGLDVSIADLERALARFGTNSGGGYVDQGGSEFVIRAIASPADLDTLGHLVVATRNGTPILLRQVAHASIAPKPSRGSAGVDGRDAVILSVQKQPRADTRIVTEAATAALRVLQQGAPAGVRVDRVVFRQSDFIDTALGNVQRALIESILVVGVVLFLFLGTVRATLVSLVAIPLSVLAALLVFRGFGIGINTMTLGGLAIAMGELVDDAVVGVENALRRLKENRAAGHPRATLAVIAAASEEVRSGILYATLIIVLVLLPVFAVTSIEGRLLIPLATAYIVALLASLATAITVTPVLCALLLARGRTLAAPDAPLARWLKAGLRRLLPRALANPFAVMAAAGVSVVLALAGLALLPRALMPTFNEGSLTVELSAAPGIALADSSRLGAIAERLLLQVPETASVARRTGRAELDEHAQGVQTSEIDVALKPSSRSRAEIVRDIRQRLAVLPVAINIGQPISHRLDHLLSGVRAQIVIKVFGDELDTASVLAERLRRELASVAGIVDLQTERQSRVPTIEVRGDGRRAALYGTTPAAVTDAVTALANGLTVSQLAAGNMRVDVAMRLDDRDRTAAGLSHLLVETPNGRVPVRLLADVAEADGHAQILREDGRRRVAVYANTDAGDLGSAITAVRDVIARQSLPPSYAVTLEGAFVSQEQAVQRLALLGAAALLAAFLLLIGRYRSATLALVVMANVPLAFAGGVAALAIAGLPVSLASAVGFVTLAGISVRNGILKVSHYLNLALADRMPFGEDLILRGSLERLTPVAMTAAAAGTALLPLLTEADAAGKEILFPVAVVVVGGLISSTLLDTFLTPVLFGRFGAGPLKRLMRLRDRGEAEAA
ncbi:MAG TPA: efflux RND transporter permease subunit [Xanthobacteraceae bacterium]|nr:efflux RND transporter permease subunit [Xanthobacteraceae bacterium]